MLTQSFSLDRSFNSFRQSRCTFGSHSLLVSHYIVIISPKRMPVGDSMAVATRLVSFMMCFIQRRLTSCCSNLMTIVRMARTHTQTHTWPYTLTHARTHIHPYMHTHTQTCMHMHTTHAPTHTRTHTRAHTHGHSHARVRTQMRKRIHICTRRPQSLARTQAHTEIGIGFKKGVIYPCWYSWRDIKCYLPWTG